MTPSQHSAFKMTYSPFLDRAKLSGDAAVAQMADDLRVFVANAGAVHESHLDLIGWLPDQIAKHGTAARRLAFQSGERVL